MAIDRKSVGRAAHFFSLGDATHSLFSLGVLVAFWHRRMMQPSCRYGNRTLLAPLTMKKRQQTFKFNPEVYVKDAIEHKFGCSAYIEEFWGKGDRHCDTFSLEHDRTRLVYAWLKAGDNPLFPKVEMTTDPNQAPTEEESP